MKIRSNLHAGAELCPQANLWRKRAEAAAETLLTCKQIQKQIPYPYDPRYINPGVVVSAPAIGGGGSYYTGQDYSGYCG